MAETKPTAKAKATTSVEPKKSSNLISILAPVACIIAGYMIWRFGLGADSGFTKPDLTGGFWPSHKGPKGAFYRMYEGGIIVPILIGCFLMVLTFSIERFMTIGKAQGTGNIGDFIRKVQFELANKNLDAELAACDAACAAAWDTACCTAVATTGVVTGHGLDNTWLTHMYTAPDAASV
jgi:biopolymer transport protein ExbB